MQLFTQNRPIAVNTWLPASDLSNLQVTWEAGRRGISTLIIYDIDAPIPVDPFNSPYVHLPITNILGNDIAKGNVAIAYAAPNPPAQLQQQHRYVVALYSQRAMMTPMSLSLRQKFPLETFISQNGLILVESQMLVVDPTTQQYFLAESEHKVTFNPQHPLIIGNTTLSEQEQKFCSCVVEVAAKQPGVVILRKHGFKREMEKNAIIPWLFVPQVLELHHVNATKIIIMINSQVLN